MITSPNYPSNYPHNKDKEYKLEAGKGARVSLTFTHFALEEEEVAILPGGPECEYDWVKVMDGNGTELMAKACGSTLPGKVTSKTSTMVVKFHSDESVNDKGFRAQWEEVSWTEIPGVQ